MKLALGLGINQRAENLESMSGFSIDSLSGLVAWYPFNTGQTVDGDALVSWADASGNSRTLTNTGQTNKRPTYESGRVNWGDVNQSFMDIQNAPVPNTAPATYFFVVELTVGSSSTFSQFLTIDGSENTFKFLWGTISGQTNQLWQVINGGFSGAPATMQMSSLSGTGKLVNNQKTIIQFTYGGGATAGDSTMNMSTDADGGSLTSCINLTTETNTADAVYAWDTVGHDGNNYIKGYCDEIVIFNRKLSVSEAADVRADLKARNNMT